RRLCFRQRAGEGLGRNMMAIFGMKLPLSSARSSIPFTGRSTSFSTQAKKEEEEEEEACLLEENLQKKTPCFRLP
ncbi:hypothetical protein CRENBAI_000806, partial [Crenichthys baileyi]